MTDKQKIYRMEFKFEYLVYRLSNTLVENGIFLNIKDAEDSIRNDCEWAMKQKGIKYPFKVEDK